LATTSNTAILTAGIAGLVAGALSMAAGEYISVSSQRDSQKVLLETERKQLENNPKEELRELAQMYEMKGLSSETAARVAEELTAKDVFTAHAAIELNIDPTDLTNPIHAAIASATSFTIGAIIPVAAILLAPQKYRIIITFFAVITALVITGSISSRFSGASRSRTVLRVLIGGILAMTITYAIGRLVGSSHF
jgi:VIT1/CCC1 family predicted Fe2+/Mn2+ transporter